MIYVLNDNQTGEKRKSRARGAGTWGAWRCQPAWHHPDKPTVLLCTEQTPLSRARSQRPPLTPEEEAPRAEAHQAALLPQPRKKTKKQKTRHGALTTGDGESAMLPTDAFSSSTVAALFRMSLACSGLILMLNFLWASSSSSDSLEE